MAEEDSLDRSLSWSPKVKPEKIRRLYHVYAAVGIVDEELIYEVGYALYSRCRDIWCVTECRCPECTGELNTIPIGKYSCLQCPQCGWVIRKKRFRSSHKGKRLVGGSAYPAFQRYLGDYERASTPHEKMRIIDHLIHAFHGDYQGDRARLRRTACSSILEGTDADLARMLNDLAYGENADPRLLETRDKWRTKVSEGRAAAEAWKKKNRKESISQP